MLKTAVKKNSSVDRLLLLQMMGRKLGKWKWEGVRRKMMGIINPKSARERETPASF